ncbi:hypothetical protein KR018_008903 [Drosophila ironensis]|nr:hypothetical protein KR018_008903 [Drosophila ironensis]
MGEGLRINGNDETSADEEVKLVSRGMKQPNPNRCAVKRCSVTIKRSTQPKYKLHPLPNAEERAKMWLHNIGLSLDRSLWERVRVCGTHFDRDCFENSKLRMGAVPTVRLAHYSSNKYLSEWTTTKKKAKQSRKY